MPALDPHQCGQLVLAVRGFDISGAEGHHHPIGMLARLLVNTVYELQRAVRILARVQRGLHPDGKKLGAKIAALRFLQVEMQVNGRLGEVEVRIEEKLRGVRVRINDDRGIMDGFGLGRHVYLGECRNRKE